MGSSFTVGLVQESVANDVQKNVDRAVARVREAADRGAQIVCLQELFNAPYFCKSQKHERFDLAEPIPGPTIEQMQKLARELELVIIVPIFERQAAGVYRNSAAVIDADGSYLGAYRKMHIPDDPLFNEKFYFTPGDSHIADDGDHKGASGFRVWKTRYASIGVLICWDQWYPEAARITSLLGAEIIFIRPQSVGTLRRKPSTVKRRLMRGALHSARTPSRTACTSRRRTAWVTRMSPGPTVSSFLVTHSSVIRSDEFSPKPGQSR